MKPMSDDWRERLDKAKTNEEFIGLLNEIPLSADSSSTTPDGRGSSSMEPRPILRPSILTTQDD